MSGIAGLFHPGVAKPVDPARIARMTDAMVHRGPGGEGVWTGPGVGLGHRRLEAADGAAATQPMRDGALTLICDGAIFNLGELHDALAARNGLSRTAEGAKVLLHAWRAWGPAMLDRLDGAFAFALHDADTQTLFLARDRLGEKPLHYAELADGAVAFASELKGLLAHPLVRRVPDVRAVEDFFAWGYVPDDACLIAGVRKLQPGHLLLLERGKPVPPERRWWQISFADRVSGSTATLAEELTDKLRTAVRSRMTAAMPVGALLSGGVGSAAVVAMMAEASPHAVKTCTIDLDGPKDQGDAAMVARRFHTDHHALVIQSDDVAPIETLVRAFDEPFADPDALAAYQMSAWAREQVVVALSGHGRSVALEGRRFRFADPFRAMLGLRSPAGNEAYIRTTEVTSPVLRERLFSMAARQELGGYHAEDSWLAAMRDAPARDFLDRARYAELTRALPGGVLTKADRTSVAVSLDMRAPLLDHRLIEFAATLPASGELFRRALKPYLPRDILHRPTIGLVTPISNWFRGALVEEAAALSRSRVLADTGWFDLTVLADLAAQHRAGRADHGRTLWQFLMLEKSLMSIFG